MMSQTLWLIFINASRQTVDDKFRRRRLRRGAQKYNKAVTVEVLQQIDALYKSTYGEHGMLF